MSTRVQVLLEPPAQAARREREQIRVIRMLYRVGLILPPRRCAYRPTVIHPCQYSSSPCHRNRVNRNHLRKFASVPLKKLEVACLGSADLVSVSAENRNLLDSLGSQGKNRNPLACLRNAGSYDKVSYCIKVLVARRSRQEPSKANLGYGLYDGSVITVKGELTF